ncbi:MAG: helix-turn-helix domain-containing protein [Gemmatimonadales bacterium]
MSTFGLVESKVTVAAVVGPVERARLDAAGAGCFAVIHRASVPAAVRTVRERAVDAIVLSVHECAREPADVVDHLVRSFPEIPTVALVSRADPAASATLLRLGATGVRHVVDVTDPGGWVRLRQLLLEPVSRPAARILGRLGDLLDRVPPETRLFVEFLVRMAPSTPNVRLLARQARVASSTLVSRFLRAGLPSPKSYLAGIRLLYAAQFFEQEGLTVADVAYRLECSSPQSFGRHLRAMLGVTAGEFRRRYSFEKAVDRFVAVMVKPYLDRWATFHPLVSESRRRAKRGAKARTLREELPHARQ